MQEGSSTSGTRGREETTPAQWPQRWETLLQGRSVVPWGESVGLSTGTVHRLSKGKFPDPEKLITAVRVERVSLSWLVDGKGSPFLVTATNSDEETAELLYETLDDEPDQVVTLVCTAHGQPRVAVLTQPAQFLHKEQWTDYTAVQVIAGPIATESIAAIAAIAENEVRRLAMSETQVHELATGITGNVPLVGWVANPRGLVDDATPIIIKDYRATPRAAEEPAPAYLLRPSPNTDTHEAITILDQLDPTTRATVLTMLRALAPPRR